jgi:hypothetical protein
MNLNYKQVSWLIGLVVIVAGSIIIPDFIFNFRNGLVHLIEGQTISPEESSAIFTLIILGLIGKAVSHTVVYLMKWNKGEIDEKQSPFTSPITSYLMNTKLYNNKKTLKYALIFFLVGIVLWIILIFLIKS